MPVDYFDLFGLPRHLDIDLADLERRFYQLSRKSHPDLFARKSVAERLSAEETTAMLNDGYRTLKDPILSAEYVLTSSGLPAAEQSAPADLLEEVFDLNMAMEELRSGDDAARPQLAEAAAKFTGMRDAIDTELKEQFRRQDLSSETLNKIRALLNRRKYIANLLRDAEAELNK